MVASAVVCAVAVLAFAVAVATGADGGPSPADSVIASGAIAAAADGAPPASESASNPSPGGEGPPHAALVSTRERVLRHEALPCTGARQPANFEVFSAGPSVGGVPLSGFKRRCGGATPADEPPANFTNYIYGDCESAGSDTGCAPPLEVQTWPACQRSLGDYSFEGKPMPYRRLASHDGAEVVEIEFMFEPRIEVYTKSSTIVIFSEDPALAREAAAQLTSQEIGEPPATQAGELEGAPGEGLAPPAENATEGELPCQS